MAKDEKILLTEIHCELNTLLAQVRRMPAVMSEEIALKNSVIARVQAINQKTVGFSAIYRITEE